MNIEEKIWDHSYYMEILAKRIKYLEDSINARLSLQTDIINTLIKEVNDIKQS